MPKKVNLYFYKSMHKYLAFQRSSSDNIAASSLTLCEQTDGYEVTNIVSLEVPDLGISGYNDGLNGFIERIVNPNVMEVKLDATLIPRKRTITDWDPLKSLPHFTRFRCVQTNQQVQNMPRTGIDGSIFFSPLATQAPILMPSFWVDG